MKGHLFFQFNQFLDSRAEIHQYVFFGKFKTSKSHSEIKWPLVKRGFELGTRFFLPKDRRFSDK